MISVSTLLLNVSQEVARLAQVAEGLDAIVGDLAASDLSGATPLATDFQDIDALRQSLHAIAKLTATAARDIPCDADIWLGKSNLAEGVTLEKVRKACLQTHVPFEASDGEQDVPSSGADGQIFFDEF